MHKAVKAAAAGIAAAMISMSAAQANEPLVEEKAIPGEFSANVGVYSEYFFRGISQTDDTPALQGGIDWSVSLTDTWNIGMYLGTWGSNVDFNDTDGASVELDGYGGFTGTLGNTGIGWDVGFIYYGYPGANSSLNYDFWEVKGALSYDFGFASATASVNYAWEYFGESGDAVYPMLAIDVPIGKYFTLSGTVGKQWIDNNTAFGQPDYVDYSIGGSVNIAGFDVGVTWTDTNISSCDDACGMVVFNVSRSF